LPVDHANPTLYRAGWPSGGHARLATWLVTLFVGAVTTLIACFPFVFTKTPAFVAIYGILLCRLGHCGDRTLDLPSPWVTQYWSTRKGSWSTGRAGQLGDVAIVRRGLLGTRWLPG
jgi:NCS1 family nucleobase:cation symporter-1